MIMQKPSLKSVRTLLKSKLYSKRLVFLPGYGMGIMCVICGKWIQTPEMHEAFITRGDVSGNEDLMLRIMVAENCVFVHTDKCHKEAMTEDGQKKCALALLNAEGFDKIIDWLNTLEPDFRSQDTINKAKKLLLEVYHERLLSELQVTPE